jgi:hypothetical protein
MQPQDTDALEAAAWRAFIQQLAQQLAGQWPAMQALLGERHGAFVELAVEQGGQRGLSDAASVARYVNLCFVWGPAFQDKAGFEWAAGLLAATAGDQWLTVHQLVQRSLLELQRLAGARVTPAALAAADAGVVASFGALGRQGAMLAAERLAPDDLLVRPQAACDLEAVELRLLDDATEPPQEYWLQGDAWQRVPVSPPTPLRIGAGYPVPRLVGLLSHQSGHGRPAKLQLRARTHAVCNGDIHPALAFTGQQRWDWAGHETRAVSWPVATREQPLPTPGPGCVIAEETSPELHKLELSVCGLRDEGMPMVAQGRLQTLVSAWPAAQWWLEIQRARPEPQPLLPGATAWTRAVSRCRVERDGTAQDSAPLQQQFEAGLDAALADALQQLAARWQQMPGLSGARFEAQLGLLVGQMACTWGWRLGASGLGSRALMRLLARFEMEACLADLQFGGELALADSKTRVDLRVAGQAALRQQVLHEVAAPLAEALLPAVAQWSFPFELSLEPLANDAGSLLQQAGPVSGALVGTAGLRPCTHGFSGWEWFVNLRLDAVAVPLQRLDPLLGSVQWTQPLLPALLLVDWSMG